MSKFGVTVNSGIAFRSKRSVTTIMLALLIIVAIMLVSCSESEPADEPTPTPTDTPVPQETEDAVWAKIQAAGKMEIGTSADYPPFEYYDDDFQIDGLDIALIKEIGRHLGLEVAINDMAFDGLGNALQVDQIDVAISAISYTPEREQFVDFSNIYYVSEDAVLANAASEIDAIPSQEELAHLKVGVGSGTVYENNITINLVESEIMPAGNLHSYQHVRDAIIDLMNGRLDLVVLDLEPAKVAAEGGDVKIVAQGLNTQQYAMAVPQEARTLQRELNRALFDIQNDGTFAGLVEKYLGLTADEIQPLPPDLTPETQPPAPPSGGACIDSMDYVQDLSYDDENLTNLPLLMPGEAFQKGWRVRNSGTCTWNNEVGLLPVDGNDPAARMGGTIIVVEGEVQPGQTYDFWADLVAPINAGTYVEYWTMRNNKSGLLFGDRLTVAVNVATVVTPTPLPTQTPTAGVRFWADPTTVNQGQCSTLYWETENVQAVYLYEQGENWQEHGVTGNGSQVICPQVTTTYELRVVKLDGSVEIRTATVFVVPVAGAPVITRFTVDPPNQIAVGQCVTVQWVVQGQVNAVAIWRDEVVIWPSAPFSGAIQDCPPSAGQHVYTIEATGPGGTSRANWYINVVDSSTPVPTSTPTVAAMTPTPATEPVIYYFTAAPETIQPGQCTVISWSVGGNASRVNLFKNNFIVQENVPFRSQWNDCTNTNLGTIIYMVVATSSINQTATQNVVVNISAGP